MVDDIVHEIAHAAEESYGLDIYGDLKVKREFLEKICFKKISSFSNPEYFEIRQSIDLRNTGSSDKKWRAFTATKFGSVRLIDNIALN